MSGVDPELGLVVSAWVECPECLEAGSSRPASVSPKDEETATRVAPEVMARTLADALGADIIASVSPRVTKASALRIVSDCAERAIAEELQGRAGDDIRSAHMTPDLIERLRGYLSQSAMTPTESFELAADEFFRATGFMAPGKSVPLEMSAQSDEARAQTWAKWNDARREQWRADLREVIAILERTKQE